MKTIKRNPTNNPNEIYIRDYYLIVRGGKDTTLSDEEMYRAIYEEAFDEPYSSDIELTYEDEFILDL